MTKGRKRKAGKRENNGRLSRKAVDVAARIDMANADLDRAERATVSVGLEARVRMFGVDPRHARDQMAGSFIGRLCLQRVITRRQYDAAMQWLEDSMRYSIAVAAPHAPGAVDLNRTHGRASDYENEAVTRHAVAVYEAAREAVQNLQNELRGTANLWAALDYIVRRDEEVYHMVGDFRLVANALVRHYRMDGQRRVA